MAESIDIEAAIQTLENGEEEEQLEGLRMLLDHSENQPDDIISHLDLICSFADNDNENIQSTVAQILAAIAGHDPSAAIPHSDVVSSLLMSDDPFVLAFATLAARRITPESPAALSDVTDRLFNLLAYEKDWASDLASSTRSRAVLALGDLGEVNPTLAARLDEPLAERLNDENSSVRSSTVITLTQLGLAHPKAISTALARFPTRLDDPDPETRYQTILACVHFRHDQPSAISQPEEVATALRRAVEQADLDSDERKVAIETCKYFEKIGGEKGG